MGENNSADAGRHIGVAGSAIGLLVFLATMGTHLVGILRALRSPASAARVSATTLGLYLAIVGALAGWLLGRRSEERPGHELERDRVARLLWSVVGVVREIIELG